MIDYVTLADKDVVTRLMMQLQNRQAVLLTITRFHFEGQITADRYQRMCDLLSTFPFGVIPNERPKEPVS